MSQRRALWPHQQQALDYCRDHQHPALLMEMRLGKSLVVIRALEESGHNTQVLVVAPSSALGDWDRELRREGYTDDEVTFLQGSRKLRLQTLEIPWRYVLANRESWLSVPEIADIPWSAVVLDESPSIKNPQSGISKFFRFNFRRVPRRFILTGTPAPESLADLWGQFDYLDGGAFGFTNYYGFRSKLFVPTEAGGGWYPRIGAERLIQNSLSQKAFVLRCKDVHLDQPRIRERREMELSPKARRAYLKAEDELILGFETEREREVSTLMQQYAYCRQLASGIDPDTGQVRWTGKLEELKYLLHGELKDEPVVIWFAFNAEIDAAREYLSPDPRLGYAYGRHTPQERRELFASFQKGDVRVLLLQVKIAQYGLDLSRASTAIYFSSPVSRMDRVQTEARIATARPGAEGRPLLFIDFVTARTVDTDVLALLRRKEKREVGMLDIVRHIQNRRNQR